MGPLRKSRSVNKRYSDMTDVSPSKDVDNGKSSGNIRKRKLSDMLGPQWNKEELTRFYDAYRKHGKDWKKVAAAVRHRSVEMVEAVYTMNRAYLSLPEGTASVVGLIAMMTDHYSNMAGSDTEQESDDGVGTSVKPQKRARGKTQPSTSKGFDEQFVFHSPTSASGYSYPTLMKKQQTGGNKPRPVGKRTPRYPVSRSNENVKGEKFFSLTRPNLKTNVDTNDDDFTHRIALALTEASQRGGSPQGSQTPNRRTDVVMPSPSRNAKFKRSEMKMNNAKLVASDVDDDDLEGSMEADTGELPRHRTLKKQSGQAGKGVQKRRKTEGKKAYINDDNQFEDIREACSGTEEGQRLKAVRRTLDADGNIQISRASPKGSKRRSKKALFGREDPDDNTAFDALNTLAALSTMMTSRELEDESFPQIKDEEDDHVGESGYSEAMPPTQNMREKRRSPGFKHKGDNSKPRDGVVSNKMPKSGRASSNVDDNIASEVQPEGHHSKSTRKKPKNLPKIFNPEARVTGHMTESQDSEAKDHGKMSKNKRPSQINLNKQMKNAEIFSSIDARIEGIDSAQTTSRIPPSNDTALPLKHRDKRKSMMDPKKSQLQNDPHDPAFTVKEKLSNCLSNKIFRRWCKCEWFYSAIEYPWYARKEFVEYLHHVRLGHVRRLTHVEWGVIRSSLGKPRRFSQAFLKEEKNKLKQYRESVRKHYADLREGAVEGLPTDLARPLSVGQRVIAIHPKTREIHDGSVLTVDQSRCRVQFDRPELGVEFVMDIDCMPLNPLENIPQLNARHAAVDKLYENFNELRLHEQSKECIKPPCDETENLSVSHLSKSTYPGANLLRPKAASEDPNQQNGITPNEASVGHHADYPQSLSAPVHAKEADVQAIAELTRALDKKEAVVLELRRMNDDVLDNSSLKESESFQKQYANVLVLLQEANEQVSASVFRLRERNTYQGAASLGWPRSIANNLGGDPGGVINAFENSVCPPYEAGSHVKEIIETSRSKARTMVDVAMKAVSSLQRRENVFDKIEEAIDFVNEQLPADDSTQPQASDATLKESSDKDGSQIPSELITQCVATLLMIQKCTERQFPPADVAQILESAVTSLKPCCSQNLPVYSEIQKCMGMIRNQILALIPT